MGNELEIVEVIFNNPFELRDIDTRWSGDKSALIPWTEDACAGEPVFKCECGFSNLLYIPVLYGLPHQCLKCGLTYKPHIDGVELLRDERGNDGR